VPRLVNQSEPQSTSPLADRHRASRPASWSLHILRPHSVGHPPKRRSDNRVLMRGALWSDGRLAAFSVSNMQLPLLG